MAITKSSIANGPYILWVFAARSDGSHFDRRRSLSGRSGHAATAGAVSIRRD
jgi:hypothetical protein